MAKKLSDTVHLKLRFPEALRRRLAKAAKQNSRSMNTEIIHRLNSSLEQESPKLLATVSKYGPLVENGKVNPEAAAAMLELARSMRADIAASEKIYLEIENLIQSINPENPNKDSAA